MNCARGELICQKALRQWESGQARHISLAEGVEAALSTCGIGFVLLVVLGRAHASGNTTG
jgi:hypothetical protein